MEPVARRGTDNDLQMAQVAQDEAERLMRAAMVSGVETEIRDRGEQLLAAERRLARVSAAQPAPLDEQESTPS